MWFPAIKRYALLALEGTPEVLDALLKSTPADAEVWDARPDPERFSLREMIAHLADWEPIWLMRIERTLTEDHPTLPDLDENQMVVDNGYAQQNPHANLIRFRQGREQVVPKLRSLSEAAWERTAYRDTLGDLNIEGITAMMLGHDGYHTRQAAEWIKSAQ